MNLFKRMSIREQEASLLFQTKPTFQPVISLLRQLLAGITMMFRVLAMVVPALIKAQVVKISLGKTADLINKVDEPDISDDYKGYKMFWIIEELVRPKSRENSKTERNSFEEKAERSLFENKAERNSFELEWHHLVNWYFENHILR